ncbi:MAG: LuxR C-terminal-related transcriptional regulator [Bacteroidota bacterium]|nr:LuxR C-terminal-related transcriptional regulator [Bacteroidota bacterium]MDX5429933.1 LuxR C-terminal-related transcriptional regulator [Bacteroidota bacterium]MDX5468706.1 LuxR C-terminal-related transcriptional regulator [Bacteroidota bacterium]
MKTNLTKREEEIIKLISQEYTSSQIARQLDISVRTVETHRKNLLLKTHSNSVVGLIKFAIRAGWVPCFQGVGNYT